MNHDAPAAPLLESARHGMESAWSEIVNRFSPLIANVCHRYGLVGADSQDVAGAVWLRLVTSMTTIREPRALPGWILTTARNECRMLLRHKNRQIPTDTDLIADRAAPDLHADLIEEERRTAARQALTQLPPPDRDLLSLLFADPPTPYKTISATLNIPIGAIGPTRARCLTRARHTPAITTLAAADHTDSPSH
jgi:RNA polymerase sigma factor (sigma-70 family)